MTTINATSAPNATTFPPLADPIAPAPTPEADSAARVSHKSRTVAVLLQIFLAPFGAADFYLGRWIAALIRIVTGALTSVILGFGYLELAVGANMHDTTTAMLGTWTWVAGCALLTIWVAWYLISIVAIVARRGRCATDRQGLPLR